ncbi:histidine kinase [Cellulophaga sp. E16_2]|uniref:sensor histidine kinase n=1 Tax=Cellulophaga sp. E16_2 TaxID=2789297 RepID=UPI001A91AC3D|nr:histidine kinase [Cellulophaga sp. E16_2]MBO0590456.1 histidine kinase [Cellulophaga sp. E16_2]
MMKKIISNNLFWVLQILGWGAFSFLLSKTPGLTNDWQGMLVVFLDTMVVFIFMTSILRWVLNKTAPLENFNAITFFKILLAIVITTSILPTLTYYVGYGSGKIAEFIFDDSSGILEKPSQKTSTIGRYFVYGAIIIGWTIFFYIIKLVRNSITESVKRLELKDKVKQAQLNTLKGHLNPQFIFTSLNNIKGLMLEDVSKSRAMLTTLSEMLRYSLTKNDVNTVILEDEIEFVKSYVEILDIEGKNRLSTSYELDGDSQQLQVPPLLLSNLLELATRHGILNTKKGGRLIVKSELRNDRLELSITHSGKMILSKSRQVLENTIKQRLRLLYGSDGWYLGNYQIDKNILLVVIPINPLKVELN